MNDQPKNDEGLATALSHDSVDQTEALTGQNEHAQTANAPLSEDNPVDKKEIGGPKGLEPTRYGDWESKGRCYDF